VEIHVSQEPEVLGAATPKSTPATGTPLPYTLLSLGLAPTSFGLYKLAHLLRQIRGSVSL
jgi:hypothetical protein